MKKILITLLTFTLFGGALSLLFPDKAATLMDYVKLQITSK